MVGTWVLDRRLLGACVGEPAHPLLYARGIAEAVYCRAHVRDHERLQLVDGQAGQLHVVGGFHCWLEDEGAAQADRQMLGVQALAGPEHELLDAAQAVPIRDPALLR